MAPAVNKHPALIAATRKSRFARHMLLRSIFIVLLASCLAHLD
jgi:hypothetical protein